MPPEAIAKYMQKDYKDVIENAAYHTLVYLREKLTIDNEFIKGWKDALIAGTEIYYVGVQNDEPYLERVNPLFFSYDKSPDLEFIEDGSWCCRRMRLPVAEIYDRYFDKLEEKDLNKLNEMLTGRPTNDHGDKDMVDNFNSIQMHIYDNPIYDQKSRYCINVYHCCWKSFKKIYYVTYQDEAGEIQTEIVDETYKKIGTEISVEPDWIIEVWEGYRAGSDLYFGIQPIEYQHVSIDNPNAQKLPYCGCIYSNTNSRPRSLVSILKPLQYMYIVLWYRLELAIARDGGRALVMDVTQIPKSMNITPERWLHYLKSVGVVFINPQEEGWGNQERVGGKCFAPGTKVIMADGRIKNIEDIKIGDKVMGPDGCSRNVLELHSGKDHMYKITPSSGSDVQIVNSRHEIYYGLKHKNGSVTFETATPVELMDRFAEKPSRRDKHFLYRSTNVRFENTDVPFDPYMLGLWLGDGNSYAPCITTMDPEIMDYCEEFAKAHNMCIRYEKIPGEQALNIFFKATNKSARGYNNCKVNYFTECLKKLNLLKNKHIPEEYIYTSEENRLQLLAGLIDTDGWYDPTNNNIGFSQCASRKQMVYDAAFIARSLGMKASVRMKKGRATGICNNSKVENSYVLTIFAGAERIPTKIARKQKMTPKTWALDNNRTMFKVEYHGVGDYYGFSTDGDHLFLLSDFTIVHNSATFNQFQSVDLSMG